MFTLLKVNSYLIRLCSQKTTETHFIDELLLKLANPISVNLKKMLSSRWSLTKLFLSTTIFKHLKSSFSVFTKHNQSSYVSPLTNLAITNHKSMSHIHIPYTYFNTFILVTDVFSCNSQEGRYCMLAMYSLSLTRV